MELFRVDKQSLGPARDVWRRSPDRKTPAATHAEQPVEYRRWKMCYRAGAIDKAESIYFVENVELLGKCCNDVHMVGTILGLSKGRSMNRVTCCIALYADIR